MMPRFSRLALPFLFTALLFAGCSSEEDATPDESVEEVATDDGVPNDEAPDSTIAPDDPGMSYELSIDLARELSTSHEAIVAKFGAENVATEEEALYPGEMYPVTVIYPDDPARRLEVIWVEVAERPDLSFTTVRVSNTPSEWYSSSGVTTGVTIDSVERINGVPFLITAYAQHVNGEITEGEVVDWSGGSFASMTPEGVTFSAVFSATDEDRERVGEENLPENNEEAPDVRSDDKIVRDLNPRVSSFSITFPAE